MAKKLKKRADGRYQRRVTLGVDFETGKLVTKDVYGYSMQEVEQKVAQLEAKYERIDYNDLTVRQYIHTYIDQRKKELVADNGLNTIEGYELTFDTHVIPVIGNHRLTDINTPMLRDLINNVKSKRKSCTGQRTRQYVYTVLNLLFKRAFKDSLINYNPMLAIDKPKHTHNEAGVIGVTQLEKLVSIAKKDDEQLARLFDIIFDSAVRRGEALALRCSDIDFKKLTISIARSLKRTKAKGLIENEPKTKNSKRILLMPHYSMSVIAEQRNYALERVRGVGMKWSEGYHLFLDENLQPLKPDFVTRAFTKYRKMLGLPDNVTLKSLRHSCATLLSEEDISPKKIQLKLGHASAAFTLDRYNHNTVSMQQSVANTLEQIRKPK